MNRGMATSDIVFYDTSALVDLVRLPERSRKRAVEAIMDTTGPSTTHSYHIVSLAEIATNAHVEVGQSMGFRERHRLPTRNEVAVRAEGHRVLLLALAGVLRREHNEWRAVLPFELRPRVPDYRDWRALWTQRFDSRMLRCESGRVVPVASMVDHQILAMALCASRSGSSVVFACSDRRVIGSAQSCGLRVLDTKNPNGSRQHEWYDCRRDGSCVRGAADVVADCDRFLGDGVLLALEETVPRRDG